MRRLLKLLLRKLMATFSREQLLGDGDPAFTKVNMKLERGLLEPGTLALAINKRLRYGSADTRAGTSTLPAPARGTYPGTPYQASLVYTPSTASVTDTLLIVNKNATTGAEEVTRQRDGALVSPAVPFPTGGSDPGPDVPRNLIQVFDRVLALSGPGDPLMEWDGSSLAGFAAVVDSTPADPSTVLMPGGTVGCMFGDRLIVAKSRDELAVSLINDYTRTDSDFWTIRVNQGENDEITQLFPFGDKVIVFKAKHIYAVGEILSADPDLVTVFPINNTIGCAAPKTVVQVGGDILFLNESGIFRLGQVIEDRLETSPIPISDAIAPLLARVNWTKPSLYNLYKPPGYFACAAMFGEYVFFALPIDGSMYNNAIAVWNTVSQVWEGYDTIALTEGDPLEGEFYDVGTGASIDALHPMIIDGRRQLVAVDYRNGHVAKIYDPEAGTDTWRNYAGELEEVNIHDTIQTRGYATKIGATMRKRFTRVRMAMGSDRPSVTVTAISDGEAEERELTAAPITKDPTKSYLWGETTNGKPEAYADGRLQESIEKQSTSISGRWLSIEIANTQGKCNVRSVDVEAVPAAGREAARAA